MNVDAYSECFNEVVRCPKRGTANGCRLGEVFAGNPDGANGSATVWQPDPRFELMPRV